MNSYFVFQPDLVVEATSVCDRACAGCYAPNVVSTLSAFTLYNDRPDLFLNPHMAAIALSKFESSLQMISIRGGEPTRHPDLAALIGLCSQISKAVTVETHGRWLLTESDESYSELLEIIKNSAAAIKLSFDRMHGLKPQQLRTITNFLDENQIRYFIAITESNEAQFIETRSECHWVPNEMIIFQRKTNSIVELSNPHYGVLNIRGQIMNSLNAKAEFHSDRRLMPESRSLSI
jgi:organic radical activating enzyme